MSEEKHQNGYVGVNLRTDRANVANDLQVTRAINVDFNKELGTASIRNGRYELADLDDALVRLIAKVNGFRFYVAGQNLYRDGTAVALHPKKLASTLRTEIEAFRPLNDLAIWAFLADTGVTDDGSMLKDDGTRTYKWGIDPPPETVPEPELGDQEVGGDLSLLPHTYNLTYIRFDTTNTENTQAVAHEGNPIEFSKDLTPPPA